MRKTIAASGVLIAGIVVLAVGLMNGLFTVAPAFEDLTDGFRDTVMSDQAIAATNADIAALEAVSTEFNTKVVPTLSAQLGMEPEAFNTYLASEYPAVATGAAALPDIIEQFSGVTGLIESQQANFESADALPTSSIPATTLPWLILGIGLIGIAVGIWMFLDGRMAAWAAALVGILVVASTLSLSFLAKSGDADAMNDAFRPVYTAELVQQSSGALQVVGAMGEEMQTAMIPGLADALGMSVAEVQGFIASEFPATTAALGALPDAMGRFQTTVGAFDAQLDNYDTIKDTALTPISWTVLLGGVAMALFGGFGLLFMEDVETPTPAQTTNRKRLATAGR
jgi:hypothetical protein